MSEPYRVVSALPTGTAFARFLMVKAAARGDAYTELALAEKFKDSPTVRATLDLQTKAAVAVGHDDRCHLGRPARGVRDCRRSPGAVARRVHHRRARVENAARAVSDEGAARDGQRHRRRLGWGRARDAGGGDRLRHARRRKPTKPPRSSCCRTNS